MAFIHDYVIFALGVFLLEAGWEALVFGHFSQPPFCALTFTLYSPSWLILALHLLVRLVLTSVLVLSAVPSTFLLVARIEVTPSKRLFSLTWSGRLPVHLMRRGRIFLEPILHRTSTWALFHSHPLQGTIWGWPSLRRCSSHQSLGVPRIGSSSAVPLNPSAFDHSSSAHYLLGTGPEPR